MKLLLDRSTDAYVRFRPESWDRFASQRSGAGWPPSTTLILFEAHCRDPLEAKLLLCLGPGKNTPIRERIFDRAQQNPSVLKTSSSLTDYTHLLQAVPLLKEDDLGPCLGQWHDCSQTSRSPEPVLRRTVSPAIDELVSQCFEGRRHALRALNSWGNRQACQRPVEDRLFRFSARRR